MSARDFVISVLKNPLLVTIGFSLENVRLIGREISDTLTRELDPAIPSRRKLSTRPLHVVVDPRLSEPAGYRGYYPHIALQCEPKPGDYLMEAAVVHECTHAYLDLMRLKDDEVAAYLMTVLYEYKKAPAATLDRYSQKRFYCSPRVEVEKVYEEALNLIVRLDMHRRTCMLKTEDVRPLQKALRKVEEYRHRIQGHD